MRTVRRTVMRTVMRPLRVAVLLVGLAVLALGCVAPGAGPDGEPGSTAGAGAGAAGPPSAAGQPGSTREQALERFASEHGLDHLPRSEVRIGRDGEADARLVVAALVAATPEARERGLQRVPLLPDGTGMVFVFPELPDGGARSGFWMLDTLVALDIAFVADGVIVGVATMQPCPARPCPITHPGVAYDLALEVGEGVLVAAGVLPGDRFVWSEASLGARPPAG